jgi:peptidoglycan/LPS O-acetylase OafA/YrhL
MNLKYPYILAIIIGFTMPFIPEMKPFPIILGLMYFFAGSLFGYLWPKESWRWGIWIVGPMIALLGLSVLFAGQLDVFLKKDLPIFLLAIIAACLGSFLSAWFKNSRTKGTEK